MEQKSLFTNKKAQTGGVSMVIVFAFIVLGVIFFLIISENVPPAIIKAIP